MAEIKIGPYVAEIFLKNIQDLEVDRQELVIGNYLDNIFVDLTYDIKGQALARELAEKIDGICVAVMYCFNRHSFLGEYVGDGIEKITVFNAVETDPESFEVRLVIPGTDFEKYIAYKKGSIV